ncbi:unnamed protein product [Symbiodinium sp. CCMP2592]|nr:unnamed protein product [Symbiodinium sp. CCMP2592]
MRTTMAAEDRILMQEDQLCCFEEADVQILRLGEDQEPVVVISNFLCADVLAELRATLAATSRFEEGIHWEDLSFAFPGPQFWMRRHFHLPDSWLRFLRQHPLSLAMAPILFDMSILDICFSRLASAEKPLWGSMTPLLNVSCGPRIFHPTCVDVNMIRFSTYAREMENTIVHIDTFGGEGTWTNFVFNLHLSDNFAFWKEVGARASARPRSGEAKGKKAFRKQVQRMQDMLSYGRDHMMAWREHPEFPGVNVLNDSDPTGRLELLAYVPFRLNTAVLWRSDVLHSPAFDTSSHARLSSDPATSRTLLQAFLGTHPLRQRPLEGPGLSGLHSGSARPRPEPPEPPYPVPRRPAHEAERQWADAS